MAMRNASTYHSRPRQCQPRRNGRHPAHPGSHPRDAYMYHNLCPSFTRATFLTRTRHKRPDPDGEIVYA